MKITKTSFALAAAFVASGLTLAPAMASAQEQQRTASISYTDLDLSTEDGRATLDQRIDRAARQVCELDRVQTGSRLRNREARACYEQAKSSFEERFAGIIRDARLGG
mgnify:CR=1 FL=1